MKLKPRIPRSATPRFPLIGVGASAGGLEAFTRLVKGLPYDFDGAIVFVSHLSLGRENELVQILSRVTQLPVTEVVAGTSPLRRNIYVIPSNADVVLHHDLFKLTPRKFETQPHMPIDTFLFSLANETAKFFAIAVILSGTGSDGALGMQAIKEMGGITLVQSEESARFGEMPLNAIRKAGSVDLIAKPENIAEQLVALCREPLGLGVEHDQPPFEKTTLNALFKLLQQAKGTDFSAYKTGTVGRRILRRMALRECTGLDDYMEVLTTHPEEINLLFQELLINVTSFFRDHDAFAGLTTTCFPALIRNRPKGSLIRIWVPGCATGEEAFSIAISLVDFREAHGLQIEFQIFGTDISSHSISKARVGTFREDRLSGVSPDHLRRFFTKTERGFQINRQIRDHIVFSVQDITRDPPFSNLDLVSCRNLLIYLSSPLQSRVFAMFHYALKPTGFLLLGQAEGAGEKSVSDLFSCVDTKNKIYTRSTISSRQYADVLVKQYFYKAREDHKKYQGGNLNGEDFVIKQTDRMVLDEFGPGGFLINENLRIVQFRGDTKPFLSPTPGSSSLNVMDLVRSDLRFDIRTCTSKAIETGTKVSKATTIESHGQTQRYLLEARPITGANIDGKYVLIVFNPMHTSVPTNIRQPRWRRFLKYVFGTMKSAPNPPEVMPSDFSILREKLRQTVEDRDATTEELRSANEELVSANEELQSSNEELETAKEELQSSNEELRTVNGELTVRNSELKAANANIANLLPATQIPVVMVDLNLKILMFTPAATGLFAFTDADLGRSIDSFNDALEKPELSTLGKLVLANAQVIEKQVSNKNGVRFKMKVCPFLSAGKETAGVVFSFLSIDAIVTGLEKRASDFCQRIVSTIRQPLLILDKSLHVNLANPAFFETFKTTAQETLDRSFYDLDDRQWDVKSLRKLLLEVTEKKAHFDDYSITYRLPDLGERVLLLNARAIESDNGETGSILLAIEDITDRRSAESSLKSTLNRSQVGMLQAMKSDEAKSRFLANMSHEIRTPLAAVVGFTDLLTRHPDKVGEFVDIIQRNAKHLMALIDDILDLSKVEADQLAMELVPVKVRDEVDNVVLMLIGRAKEKHLEVFCTYDVAVPLVIGTDPTRLRQILINVVGNAIKFTDSGSIKIAVKGEAPTGVNAAPHIVIRVADSGCGIEPQLHSSIFEPFCQGTPATSRKYGGTGLGLTLSRKFAQLLGGDIVLEQSSNTGSTFRISIAAPPIVAHPISSKLPAEVPETSGTALPHNALSGIRILLVEDGPDNRILLEQILTSNGAVVDVGNDGEEGVTMTLTGKYHIVLMDVQMPNLDGCSATTRLRELGQTLPIIAISAFATKEDKERCLSAGMNEYCIKPISEEDLCRAVLKWIAL